VRKTDLAWTAGVLDGEGCIRINRSKWFLALSVVNTDQKMIFRLKELFGAGSIYYGKAKPPRAARWIWSVSSNEAASVLRAVRPYLVTKQAQADLALKFLTDAKGRSGVKLSPMLLSLRESFFQQMAHLKIPVGVPV
jgi:hypothetical protein